MITQSGCFGSNKPAAVIDDINEAAAAVSAIAGTTPVENGTATAQAAADVAALLGQYARRLRLLTWAVVAIAVVLVMREVKE